MNLNQLNQLMGQCPSYFVMQTVYC